MTHPVTVLVLIDALGWPYAGDFMTDVLPVRRPLRTVLGYSSGAIPAILTGHLPSSTGHWNLYYYNPAASHFRWLRYLAFLPDSVLGHRVTRKLLKESGRHVFGLGPLFECAVNPRFLPYFDWVEKKNVYAAGGIVGAPSIFDHFERERVAYRVYSYHAGSDFALLEAARRDLRERKASFYFVYLSEIDAFLHHHCTEPDSVQKKLAWYEQQVKELFTVARHVDAEARLAIASDHGMTPVRERYDLVAGIEKLGLKMPNDYLAVYDSTMARFWFFNNSSRELITAHLSLQKAGRILYDDELRREGVLFEDRRYGELIYLLNPGCMIGRSDFNGPGWNPTGMHGYHPDDSSSDGIFLSSHETGRQMRSIIDIYGWMRDVSGLSALV